MATEIPVRTILILAANPKNTAQLRLDEEVREIEAALERARKRDRFLVRAKFAVRPRDIHRALLDLKPQIVHFSGHGGGEQGLVFENDTGQAQRVSGKALADLFELFAQQVECVLLNACYSQVQAEAIAQHIDHVIGMSQAIGDRAAIEFAVGFYDALGAGQTVEFAYKLGRNAIQMGGIPEHLIPVLLQKGQAFVPNLLNAPPLELEPQPRSTAHQREISVSRLGRGDYRTISEAIQHASMGTRILVYPGIYPEELVIDKPLEIIGVGDVAEIVIESSRSYCVSMRTDYAIVRGLTLRQQAGRQGGQYYAVDIPQGQLILEDCDITSDSLACIAIHGSTATPIIRRCQIHDGKHQGIFVYQNGQGFIEACNIFANAYPGVVIKDGGNPTIRKCKIYDGKSAGIYIPENGQGVVEDCDIFANFNAGLYIKKGSNPIIRQCQIHHGKFVGIYIDGNSQGVVEDCNIFANEYEGVEISGGSNPTIRKCQIHDGKQSGVHVHENGQGVVEACDIFANAWAGVEIKQGGNPTIRQCKINRNQYEAIWVFDNGKGTVENCDLTGNVRGAFDIEPGCQVQQKGNQV